jgi:hypothetical protein
MEPVYPWLAYNLERPEMAPLRVENAEQDARLTDDWENIYGVARGNGSDSKRKPGRPKK